MTFSESSVTTESLKKTFSRFATGVVVVSARGNDGWIGNTVSSFNTVSLSPALVLFSMQRSRRSFGVWETAEEFAVNILTSDQSELSRRFASTGPNKWDGVLTRAGQHVDAPVIKGSLATLECRVWARYDGGDHLIIVGEVLGTDQTDDPAQPLLFYDRGYHAIQPLPRPANSHAHG